MAEAREARVIRVPGAGVCEGSGWDGVERVTEHEEGGRVSGVLVSLGSGRRGRGTVVGERGEAHRGVFEAREVPFVSALLHNREPSRAPFFVLPFFLGVM